MFSNFNGHLIIRIIEIEVKEYLRLTLIMSQKSFEIFEFLNILEVFCNLDMDFFGGI